MGSASGAPVVAPELPAGAGSGGGGALRSGIAAGVVALAEAGVRFGRLPVRLLGAGGSTSLAAAGETEPDGGVIGRSIDPAGLLPRPLDGGDGGSVDPPKLSLLMLRLLGAGAVRELP
jgi:hypothetical protein